jgi:hypothetical protein
MARDFKKAAAAESAEVVKIDTSKCTAHGCPMHGSLTSSVNGSDSWTCSMHFRAHISNWQKTTQRIREHMPLVNLIKEIRMAQNGKPFDYSLWMSRLAGTNPEYIPGDEDRRRNGRLSMRMWQNRLEKLLFATVMPGMDEEEKSEGQARNAEEIMNQIEDFLKAHSMRVAA